MEFKEQPGSCMGEVRVRVKLTNGSDQMLADAGGLDRARVRSCEVEAMVDTGAVRSVITEVLARQLGIPSARLKTVAYADGRTESVPLAGPIVFDIGGRDTYDDAYVLGNEVLIGQTVLEKMDLLVDCTRQRLVPAHPDGPVNKLKSTRLEHGYEMAFGRRKESDLSLLKQGLSPSNPCSSVCLRGFS